ncbi:hypothetical protein LWI28_001682 [Acer negundo]|uniref:Transmembrane protein n=1 Tax=Acer negundo TaxID=4023 RepID=A0AAD5NGR6_ACENE|nr:hypothetical protein LWI28_001682 [Acer negundo]
MSSMAQLRSQTLSGLGFGVDVVFFGLLLVMMMVMELILVDGTLETSLALEDEERSAQEAGSPIQCRPPHPKKRKELGHQRDAGLAASTQKE